MSRKPFKRGQSASFIQLHNWFCDCPSWRSLKPGPRALYLELKRRFNGGNNGELYLSHREASIALCIGRDTAGSYFADLQHAGFILQTLGHCLGPSGLGQSAKWALTELPLNGAPASKQFMSWKKQNPRRKIQHSLAGKSDTPCWKNQLSETQMSENPAALGHFDPKTVSENPAIYTSNHMPVVPDLSTRAGLELCTFFEEKHAASSSLGT